MLPFEQVIHMSEHYFSNLINSLYPPEGDQSGYGIGFRMMM
jgi:hypothetical protein